MTQSYIGFLIEQRLSRRGLLHSALLATALPLASLQPRAATHSLGFKSITGSKEDRIILPEGYVYDVLIRWGEALSHRVPDMDATGIQKGGLLTADAALNQLQQFGSNCDAIHFFQLNAAIKSTQGVLCINNEYTNDWLMYAGRKQAFGNDPQHVRDYILQHPSVVAMSKAAHGISVVEVQRDHGPWRYLKSSKYNRRVTASTLIEIKGPARGYAWLKTQADPTGTQVRGTFGNCAGGRTPWGTYLSAEENIQDYFGNFAGFYARKKNDSAVMAAHQRWRMWSDVSPYGWEVMDQRFDASLEPNEAFRFGWIVEVDPLNSHKPPVKRTALGRFAHEAASPIVAANGKVAVYMGDDDKFEYVYKFVTAQRFDAKHPAANADLLDQGILYAARFDANGRGEWLPLVYSSDGPLNAEKGFRNQAEVLINARAAADVLGATMMDRPEDVEPNPLTGKVYIVCTRNESRADQNVQGTYGHRKIDVGPNAANPRGKNVWGHIIELTENNNDHSAVKFSWEVLLMGGDSSAGSARQSENTEDVKTDHPVSAIGSPDNIGFDAAGNLWIVTDGPQPENNNNGCFVCPVMGPQRGVIKQFMSAPVDAEVCGCVFTPDNETLFLSIQHPGEGGTLDNLSSHWPDGGNAVPRSSVMAIRKKDGGVIGS